MGFKEDADFARYLTMGAFAAKAVADDLTKRGHWITELERYAMGNKVWSIKVKRLRLPDLLCVRCGRRFESRGKSKLELKLSHSERPGREWHSGGMRENDVFAFIRIRLTDGRADTGRPVYVTRSALHDAAEALQAEARKAFSAGSEAAVKWPAWAPSYSGTIISVDADGLPQLGGSEVLITVRRDDGRSSAYRARWPSVHTYLDAGDHFAAGDIVAGSVAPASVECPGETWRWVTDLAANGEDDRFAAIKVARLREADEAEALLRALAEDENGDWRIRLEAAGVLAATDPDHWTAVIKRWASDVKAPDQEQMEGVFILSELGHLSAAEALAEIARPSAGRKPEVRSAAVWGLGLGACPRPDLVARFLDDEAELVALHAAAALPRALPSAIVQKLVNWLTDGLARQGAIAAHVLARHGHVDDLIRISCNRSAVGRLLAIRVLGDLPPEQVESFGRLPADLRQILQPIWAQHDDWLRRPENEGALPALDLQRIRF